MVVKRTPGISTTDLVGRMLLCTKSHFIKSLRRVLSGDEGSGSAKERRELGEEMTQRFKDYAMDESGLQAGPEVSSWAGSKSAMEDHMAEEAGLCSTMVTGKGPKPGQRIVYVDGGFDLFSSGHIEFLLQVTKAEEALARKSGWYEKYPQLSEGKHEERYGPAYVVAGVHDDEVINHWKGVNYPIMNIFERGLCVLQCRVSIKITLHTPSLSITNPPEKLTLPPQIQYISALILSAPFTPTKAYLTHLPYGTPQAVYHGPTSFMPLTYDPYTAAKAMGIYQEIGTHDFQNVNAGEIVQRILKSREMYEERQRVKGVKGAGEDMVRRREEMERDAEAVAVERGRANGKEVGV